MKSWILILLIACNLKEEQHPKIIKSKVADPSEYTYAENLDELQHSEKWGWHSGSLGKAEASSTLTASSSSNYNIENIYDLDLTTAWIEGKPDDGIGENIAFTLQFEEPNNAKNFNGEIEIFNGYCKSERLWKTNSRVKQMKMYLNGQSICLIELADTWQYQSFDISQYINREKIQEGDQVTFEITAIYPGTKYKDVAISEFVTPSYGGG